MNSHKSSFLLSLLIAILLSFSSAGKLPIVRVSDNSDNKEHTPRKEAGEFGNTHIQVSTHKHQHQPQLRKARQPRSDVKKKMAANKEEERTRGHNRGHDDEAKNRHYHAEHFETIAAVNTMAVNGNAARKAED